MIIYGYDHAVLLYPEQWLYCCGSGCGSGVGSEARVKRCWEFWPLYQTARVSPLVSSLSSERLQLKAETQSSTPLLLLPGRVKLIRRRLKTNHQRYRNKPIKRSSLIVNTGWGSVGFGMMFWINAGMLVWPSLTSYQKKKNWNYVLHKVN